MERKTDDYNKISKKIVNWERTEREREGERERERERKRERGWERDS